MSSNLLLNKTFEPLPTLALLASSLILSIFSFLVWRASRRVPEPIKEKPKYVPPSPVVGKQEESVKIRYSDEHLVVTSNMKERLKMFERKK